MSDPIQNYINRERVNQERHKLGTRYGGAITGNMTKLSTMQFPLVPSYTDKLLNQEQNMARYFKEELLPETDLENVVNFNFDRYVENLRSAIQGFVDTFLTSGKTYVTGSVEKEYNILISYLKSYVKYNTLTNRQKFKINEKLDGLISLLRQAIDYAMSFDEGKVDLFTAILENIQNRNYQPISLKILDNYYEKVRTNLADEQQELFENYDLLEQALDGLKALGIHPSLNRELMELEREFNATRQVINNANNRISIDKAQALFDKLKSKFSSFERRSSDIARKEARGAFAGAPVGFAPPGLPAPGLPAAPVVAEPAIIPAPVALPEPPAPPVAPLPAVAVAAPAPNSVTEAEKQALIDELNIVKPAIQNLITGFFEGKNPNAIASLSKFETDLQTIFQDYDTLLVGTFEDPRVRRSLSFILNPTTEQRKPAYKRGFSISTGNASKYGTIRPYLDRIPGEIDKMIQAVSELPVKGGAGRKQKKKIGASLSKDKAPALRGFGKTLNDVFQNEQLKIPFKIESGTISGKGKKKSDLVFGDDEPIHFGKGKMKTKKYKL